MKKIKFPNAFVVLLIIIVITTILTYIIPAGSYQRSIVDGRTVVSGNSFEFIKQTPVSLFNMFKAIPQGIISATELITMILSIGGFIAIINETSAIEALIFTIRNKVGDKNSSVIISGLVLFFGFLGAFVGMLEASIPFATICISIALALGYDIIVGMSIPFIGIVLGFTAGPTNPWTVGVGQEIGELPLYSGILYRIIILAIFMSIGALYICSYGNKVKANKNNSLVKNINNPNYYSKKKEVNLTFKRKLVILSFLLTLAMVILGTLKLNFTTIDMTTAYIIGSVVAGFIFGFNGDKISTTFLNGAKSLFVAAMAIGVSRGISIIMKSGNIQDTVIYYFSNLLNTFPSWAFAVVMYIFQGFINFFIPSGSGQAMVTLPTMLPTADIIALNRQIGILAYQLGDGITNLFYPTVGCLIGFLEVTKVPYTTWMKFITPLVGILFFTGIIILLVATLINYGPY
ncbi:MAG: YfcC family protein [Lachnospirales bacterium]